MNLFEMRTAALFQTGNDADDLSEFRPFIDSYINDGYDKLAFAYSGVHLGEQDQDGITRSRLIGTSDTPVLPEWTHQAISDYATYMLYRNGNAIKQQRGIPYYQNFSEVLMRMPNSGRVRRLKNLYEDS